MSAPRQPTPSNSPTPSKSSLRKDPTQNPSQRSLLPPPSPRFDEEPSIPVRYSPRSPPNQTLEYDSQESSSGEEDQEHPESYYREQDGPEIPFQPFFTLIEDSLSAEHHHPSVHYIFADDDHEIITEAALRSLEQDGSNSLTTTQGSATEQREGGILPLPTPGVREHYMILDVQPTSQHNQADTQADDSIAQPTPTTAYTVSAITSLSSEWQAITSVITSAPTMGEQKVDGEEGLMLRIEGRGCPPTPGMDNKARPATGVSSGDKTEVEKETLEEMIERFQQMLGEVRELMEVEGPLVPQLHDQDVERNGNQLLDAQG